MTDLRQAAETLQLEVVKLKQMLEQQQAKPTCPDCKEAVLYECVACSSNNYPPKQQAEPPQRPWVGLTDEEIKTTWSQVWYDLNHGKLSAPDAEVRNNVVVFGEALEEKLRSKNHG